ncbi:leucine rich repeat protein [Achlya hypogyna]|uniref:Leucine rich repeat protein n=1 Tax=Achlya hypogyna TaxID=1202772 RepID=A0A1V9ZT53_ACHHY|nr:leucine rich repeat protein [Achlya hypogyna]
MQTLAGRWSSRSAAELSATEIVRVANELLRTEPAESIVAHPTSCRPTRPVSASALRAATSELKKRLSADPPPPAEPTIELWLRAETTAASIALAEAALAAETLELQTSLTAPLALPFDLHLADAHLQALHAALGPRTDAYLTELYRGFRDLRRLLADAATAASDPVASLLHSQHRQLPAANVEGLVAQLQAAAPTASTLQPKALRLMVAHCDMAGDGLVDMRTFLSLVESVAPPRERCIRFAFRVLWPGALVSSGCNESLRIFKLVALVKDGRATQRCAAADADEALEWLQSFDEAALSLADWMVFHRRKSDALEADADFIAFIHSVWNVLAADVPSDGVLERQEQAAYAALLQTRHDAVTAQKAAHRRETLRQELCDLAGLVGAKCTALRDACSGLARATVQGAALCVDASILRHVFGQLHRLEALRILPVLSRLPDGPAMQGLVELDVAHAGLSSVPASLTSLVQLRVLRASNNLLSKGSVPNVPGLWPQLREVDLSANKFATLPEAFQAWTHVETCDLSGNQLVALADGVLSNWRSLRSLAVHDNRLTALPAALGLCVHLTTLACHRNALTALPAALASLPALQDVTFHHNKIDMEHTVPNLAGLRELTRCTLSHNELRSVPEPLRIGQLRALRALHLAHNHLRNLEEVDFSCLGQCTEVDLRHNRLARLPPSLFTIPHLRQLFVQANVLTALPVELAQALELVTLQAHTNHIVSVPDGLGAVASLAHVDLSHNRLATLPQAWVAFAHHRHPDGRLVLETLKLDGNPLASPLKEIVAAGSYTSPATQQLSVTLLKLVDYLQRTTTKRSKVEFATFQRLHWNDRKEYSLRVRKGQAKVATEYLEWAFRDHPVVSTKRFRSVLTELGCPWTELEWARILARFADTARVDLDRFLAAVEGVHAAAEDAGFPEQVLAYLADTASKVTVNVARAKVSRGVAPILSEPRCEEVVLPPPQPAATPTRRSTEARLRQQVLRQREHIAILQQQMQDHLRRGAIPAAHVAPPPPRSVTLQCFGATALASVNVPYDLNWTALDLKRHVETHHGIPVRNQILLAATATQRTRVANEVPMTSLLDAQPAPDLQLLVGAPVDAIYVPPCP